jgi:hypothetical protein
MFFFYYSNRNICVENFELHTSHCQRNIVMCPICVEPWPQTQISCHMNEVHKIVPCENCHITMEIQYMDRHLVSGSICSYDLTEIQFFNSAGCVYFLCVYICVVL